MARIASTTTAGVPVDPTGGMTLDALMARQKALAEARAQTAAPRDIQSPWQGLAQMAQAFVGARQEAAATDQLTAGRQQLAKIRSGINLDTGPTSEQISQASLLDPSYADNLTQLAAEAVRAKRQRDQQLADRAEGRTYQEGQTAATRTYEAGQESAIDTRELGQAQAATAAANTTEQVKHERDLAEGRVKHVTGEEAKAMNLDPTRIYEVTPSTGAAKDITPTVPESFGPVISGAEATAAGLDPEKQWQKNLKTSRWEPVGGTSPIQLLPAEVGAKLGLADLFLTNFDAIKSSAAAGDMTGAYDQPTSTMLGWGKGGESYRQIRQGTEGLVRLMTGAGMPQSEAEDRARQYEPKLTDDAPTLVSKLDGLKAAILSVRSGATAGRQAPPAPEGGTPPPAAGGLPAGVTEDDITATMAANKMTRQQVLDALAAKGGTSGGS